MGVIPVDELMWRIASRCESGACVEVGTLGEIVLVRRSADPDGPRIVVNRENWLDFVARVKDAGLERF